jgi:hypothetical protein
MRRAPILVLSLVAVLAASGWSAQTSPAAVTLGSSLGVEPTVQDFCSQVESGRGCIAVNTLLPGRQVTAPFDGVIVRWRIRLGGPTDAQTIRIRVLRPLSPEEFKIISSGSLESIPEGAGMYTFPASLPMTAGDEVGIESESGKTIVYQANLAASHSLVFNPSGMALDGSPTGTPIFDNPGLEATFNVDVEPDCDHDGLGDETQDPDLPPACKPPVLIPAPSNAFTLGKPKVNKRKGTAKEPVTVPGQGELTLAGKAVKTTSLAATAAGTVNLQVKPKGKKKRKLNSAGSAKVTITVTYTPTGGLPNSVSKKLVLRKRVR